jgi:hypothetical protein
MHFLLIPYLLLCVCFIALFDTAQFKRRGEAGARAGLMLVTGLTLLILFLSMATRSVMGDSQQYYEYFLELRDLGMVQAAVYGSFDLFFAAYVWLVGQLGTASWLLFGSTLLVYLGLFVLALRRLLGRLEACALVMVYVAYPDFINYANNGIRQGLGMVFMLVALVSFAQGRRKAWIWLLLTPFWHSGMWLAVGVVVLHQLMCLCISSQRLRWGLVLGALSVAIGLSMSGINQNLMSALPSAISLQDRYQVYFESADQFGYRAGFRLDFFAFSLVPLLTAWVLRQRVRSFDYSGCGWWLSLYLSLNIIYQLFSFAPFANRFADFSWYLMPLVVFMQVRESQSRSLMTVFMLSVMSLNLVMLQLYTGNYIPMPEWLQ